MKQTRKQSGFSLIELLIYIAILIVAITIVAVFATDVIKANRSEQGNRDTQQNARLIISKLRFETRWANSVVTPFQNDEVTLQTPSGPVRFYLDTGGEGQSAMFVERNGFAQQLTSDEVAVTTFAIETIDPALAPPSIRVDLALNDLNSQSNTSLNTIITVREK